MIAAVKAGYKQTEVGVIPEDWDVVELVEAARVVDSLHKTPTFAKDDYPMVRVADIKTGNLSFVETLMVTETVFTEFTKNYRPKRGDIVLSRVGSYGVSSFVETDEPFCLGQNTVVIQPRIPPRFLYYGLNSQVIRQQIEDGSYGSGYKSLSLKNIKELRIPAPSTDAEQRAIAEALSDVDALLVALDRLIAKKRDLKQAAMQQLLTGETRLPGFQGEWVVKRLGDAGNCLRGVSYHGDSDLSTHDTACTKRLLRSNNVQDAVITILDVQFVNAIRVAPRQLLRNDDILICIANGSKVLVGKAGLFRENDGYDYTFGAFMGCFRTDAAISNPVFVFSLFQSGKYRNYINNLLAGSSINNLRPSSIESLEFSFPPLPEQTAIAEVLSEMDGELAGLEQRREKTRALKLGMMQELLTGRTRLVAPQGTSA